MLRWLLSFVQKSEVEIEGRIYVIRTLLKKHKEQEQRGLSRIARRRLFDRLDPRVIRNGR